jgi:hypothetical protein
VHAPRSLGAIRSVDCSFVSRSAQGNAALLRGVAATLVFLDGMAVALSGLRRLEMPKVPENDDLDTLWSLASR